MRKSNKKSLSKYFLLQAILLCSLNIHAETRINGFANFVAGQTTSSDEATFLLDGSSAYEDDLSFDTESLFALQVSTDISEKVTATAQILTRGNQEFDAQFEWAYITFSATDNLSMSFGRLRAPFFKYSSSADIGYSYHWITAPSSIYDVGFNNLNGFRIDYNKYIGDWEYNFQAAGGTYADVISGGDLSGKNTLVFTAEANYEWFKTRGVWGRATASYTNNEFFDDLISQVDLVSPELADTLRLEDDTGIFVGIGLEADFYSWFIAAEATQVEQKGSFAGTDDAFYITAGARIGKFTPSITFEELDGTSDIRNQDIIDEIEDPATQGFLTAVNTSLQESAMDKNNRITATLRYDYNTSIAFKADIQTFTDDIDDSADATLVRFAINYIF